MKNIVSWTPAIVYGTLIFALSHQSYPPGHDTAPDYILHFLEFGLFTLTVLFGTTRRFQLEIGARQVWITLLIVLLWAAADEFHQLFVPHRDGSLRDWFSDSLGALVFMFAAQLFQRWRRRGVGSH